MIRALFYLVVAGVVWLAEGFIFAVKLGLHVWQIVLMACVYVGLWALATARLLHTRRAPENQDELVEWRYLSLAPMIVVILGSFVSLPILLLIVALGKAI